MKIQVVCLGANKLSSWIRANPDFILLDRRDNKHIMKMNIIIKTTYDKF